MAYIKVDHSKFDAASGAVSAYTIQLHLKELALNGHVSTLKSAWNGDDYTVFENQWRKVMENESTYKSYINMLRKYSEALKTIGNKYKDAQAKAVNNANGIPTW